MRGTSNKSALLNLLRLVSCNRPFRAINKLGMGCLRTCPFLQGIEPSGFKVKPRLLNKSTKIFLINEDYFQDT